MVVCSKCSKLDSKCLGNQESVVVVWVLTCVGSDNND